MGRHLLHGRPAVRSGSMVWALAVAGVTFGSAPAAGQEWRLGAQIGRIRYEGAAATSATTGTSVALGLSRLSLRDWLGASAGVPLEDQPFWLVGGFWKQWRQRGERGLGLNLSGHGFLQRELDEANAPLLPIDTPEADRSGEGVGGDAAVLAFAAAGPLQLEVHGGVAGQTSEVGGLRTSRLVPVVSAEARAGLQALELALGAERWFGVDSAHTYAGVIAQWEQSAFALWASAGSWLEGGTSGAVLGAGATIALTDRLQLEGSWREEAFDPLYASTTARSFSLGMSLRLAGGEVVHAPVPASYEGGRAVIRLDVSEAKGTPRIAGDFTGWEPQPMVLRDGAWEFTTRLDPGVYSYAFVNERGEWFVPESTAGRRSDGMGGYNAVLIVE